MAGVAHQLLRSQCRVRSGHVLFGPLGATVRLVRELTVVEVVRVLNCHVHTVLQVASVLLRQLTVVSHVVMRSGSVSRGQRRVTPIARVIRHVEAVRVRATSHLLHDTLVRLVHVLMVCLDELRWLMRLELAPALALFLLRLVTDGALGRQASPVEAALVGIARVVALHADELCLVSRVTIDVVSRRLLAATGACMRDRLQLWSVVHRLNLDRRRDGHGCHLRVAIAASLLLLVSGVGALINVRRRLGRATTILRARRALLDGTSSAGLAILARHVRVDSVLAHG